MRLNVWSPLPPSPSGIADYVAEQIGLLARRAELTLVVETAGTPETPTSPPVRVVREGEEDAAGLDVYHVGNSPSHAYVYRAALRRAGVVVLHDFCLHHLVLRESVERGDARSYLREMRRSYGAAGTFVGRQVARALGGDVLPALYPLNDRILDGCLGLVTLSAASAARAGRRLASRPLLHLPHHLSLPLDPVPSRQEARAALGLPQDALLVTAAGFATRAKRLDVAVRAVARLRKRHPALRLVVAGAVDEGLPLEAWAGEAGLGDAFRLTGRVSLVDFVRHLAAADVVLALRFPSYGEMSGALVRALGVGRPVLLTAGTPAEEEFPEGIVVPVSPGASEAAELESLLDHLLSRPALRESLGRLAREHVARHHALAPTVARLADFLSEVAARRTALLEEVQARRTAEQTLLGDLLDEARFGALDLGLPGVPEGVVGLLAELVREGA